MPGHLAQEAPRNAEPVRRRLFWGAVRSPRRLARLLGRGPRRLFGNVAGYPRRLFGNVAGDLRLLFSNVARDPHRLIGNVAGDPRHYQILTLAGLLIYGVVGLDLEVRPAQALAMLATALVVQLVAGRLAGLPAFDPRSAMISGLSLCLLLRTNHLALAVATAAVTILSKFVIRRGGKHVFNPTNFGIVAMMLATGRVWVSPGQWGSAAFFMFLLLCMGGLVVNRAARSDVTYAFAGFYLAIVFGRGLWLGQPLAIPFHQLASGAFLIFTFFMISDPKSTPDSRAGRILFALLVALGAGAIHFLLYRPNGLILALAGCAPLVPMIDRWLPGRKYHWAARPSIPLPERRFA